MASSARRATVVAQLIDLEWRLNDAAVDVFNKMVGWRYVDLKAEVVRRPSVEVHENTISRWPHEPGPDTPAAMAGSSPEGS
jgi:hypothetical protein